MRVRRRSSGDVLFEETWRCPPATFCGLLMTSRSTGAATCYYCGRPATSAEHVPPRCIFPERKDAFGVDRRKNLITVPSCDEHNLRKSKEDEFLMACITPVVGTNGTGFVQTQTKLRRAISRSGGRLLDISVRNTKPASLVVNDGIRLPILMGTVDMPRLCRALEHVARGLFFHRKGSHFVGKCHVIPGFVQFPDGSGLQVINRLTRLMVMQEQTDWDVHGENEDVFQYRVGPTDQYGLIPMAMTFFRGVNVYVAFQPDGVKPPHRTLNEASPDDPLRIDLFVGEGGP